VLWFYLILFLVLSVLVHFTDSSGSRFCSIQNNHNSHNIAQIWGEWHGSTPATGMLFGLF